MKKRFNWKFIVTMLMLVALAGAVLSGCGAGSTYATQKNYITIGCICPLTGDLASYAEGTLDTEEAAVATINENDGLYIDTLQRKLKVRFVVADSKSTEEGAKEAANKLAEEENVDVMICSSDTQTAIAAAKACEDLEIPFFSVGADTEIWKSEGPFTYSFNCGTNTREKCEALAELWKEQGITSVGVLATKSAGTENFVQTVYRFCKDNGFKFTDGGWQDAAAPDYAAAVQKLAGGKVEALVCYMSGEDFSRAWSEGGIRSLNLKMCVLDHEHLLPSDVAAAAPGQEILEFYSTTGWDKSYPFESSLTEETGTQLSNQWESLFLSSASELLGMKHASAEIAIDAVKLAMALDADAICSAARSLNVDTVLGTVDFDQDGISTYPCSVLRWSYDVPTVSWSKELVSHSRLTDVEFEEE